MFGKLADNHPATMTIPFAFFLRFIAIVNMTSITDPTQKRAYWYTAFVGVGVIMENISIDAYFMRIVKREIRGTLLGIYNMFGVLG